jgi:hypothetical protein
MVLRVSHGFGVNIVVRSRAIANTLAAQQQSPFGLTPMPPPKPSWLQSGHSTALSQSLTDMQPCRNPNVFTLVSIHEPVVMRH